MALILRHYLDYFVYGRSSHFRFEHGEQSYFDPIERRFLRITPSIGEVPQSHWIPLPVIREADLLKTYLCSSGNEWLIEKYADLEEIDFCVNVIRDVEKYNLDDVSGETVYSSCNKLLQKWIDDYNIPNCKICIERPNMEVNNREDAKRFKDRVSELICMEAIQEEEYKKSLH